MRKSQVKKFGALITGAVMAVAIAAPALAWVPGFMTGGGSIIKPNGTRVTHGFELHCSLEGQAPDEPNNLEVNWGVGNNFHLTDLTFAACRDSAYWEEEMPEAGFDTMRGAGTGLLNGEAGYTIKFFITDAGEPGTSDRFRFAIYDSNGDRVFRGNGLLTVGNHQAHPAV
ncbi:MAG: hypothetical protein M3454_03010 [Actinomycetota bacterium]|nr:hypothetical protein [Actinomycetota bacterium]